MEGAFSGRIDLRRLMVEKNKQFRFRHEPKAENVRYSRKMLSLDNPGR
jgi:hypothetical protein